MTGPVNDEARIGRSAPVESAVRLSDIHDGRFGGKASGLAALRRWGLNVPPAFVVADARGGAVAADVLQAYHEFGHDGSDPVVAVRSSAAGEDGVIQSFAGQYDSVLNVRGAANLESAIDHCVRSARSDRAIAYRAGDTSTTQMNVVVQRMIGAKVAGVCFTADASNGRRDVCVVDAVAGLGEALVSGLSNADHYLLGQYDNTWETVESGLADTEPLLSAQQLHDICHEARFAADQWGQPLDLEWAIDEAGRLWWLQARPITTLPGDLNELDTDLPAPDNVFTRCNIGEMMPGAVCALTQSITGYAIEFGMQQLQIAAGIQPAFEDRALQAGIFYGHMFLNMTTGTAQSSALLGNSAEQYALSTCGRIVPELEIEPPKPFVVRLRSTAKLLGFFVGTKHAIKALDRDIARFELPETQTISGLLQFVSMATEFYAQAMVVHVRSSGRSGIPNGIFEKAVGRYAAAHGLSEQEVHGRAMSLVAGEHGVEGAQLIAHLDEIVAAIAATAGFDINFAAATPSDAVRWLQGQAPRSVSAKFAEFLERHGHRGYRELCVRDPAWSDDLDELGRMLQRSLAAHLAEDTHRSARPAPHNSAGGSAIRWPLYIRWMARVVRAGAHWREHTKSSLVRVIHVLKRALRQLGELLEWQGLIPDADLVYFVTREELPALADGDSSLIEVAINRRKALPYQNRLEFPDVSVGRPRPIVRKPRELIEGDVLTGRVASPGVVEAPVRVVRHIDEAAQLQPGEILVASVTDVGWTPYFNVISGLITDIGSSLSHGAVIAREYGLPCVVNTRYATSVLRTGDWVRIDGNNGVISRPARDTAYGPRQ